MLLKKTSMKYIFSLKIVRFYFRMILLKRISSNLCSLGTSSDRGEKKMSSNLLKIKKKSTIVKRMKGREDRDGFLFKRRCIPLT